MKYTIEIYDKNIEPIALSEDELEMYEVSLKDSIHLYAMYTNSNGDEFTELISPYKIEWEVNAYIENHGKGIDLVLLYDYESENGEVVGFASPERGYNPILSMEADKNGEIQAPDILGHGIGFMDFEERIKLHNLIIKAEKIAEQALKRLNNKEEVTT